MKSLIAVCAAFVLLAPAAVGGYMLNPDPATPTVGNFLREALIFDEGSEYEEWLYVVLKGNLAGSSADAVALVQYSDKQLEKLGGGKGTFLVRKCRTYSASGKPDAILDPQYVNHCTVREVTRKQVRDYAAMIRKGGLEG